MKGVRGPHILIDAFEAAFVRPLPRSPVRGYHPSAMTEPIDILGLTSQELAAAAKERLPAGAGTSDRVYARAFAAGKVEPEAFGLSGPNSRAWREAFRVGLLEAARVVEEPGPAGVTAKAVLRTEDGSAVECVRIPMHGGERRTLCVSSQVGCRMGCAFCETGRGGLVRNLSAAEIVSEVVTARTVLGWDFSNIVFMGMGEPLDNFEGVSGALAVLLDGRGLAFAQERITVCTSGHVDGIRRLRSLGYRRLNLSVSLNSGDDETRARLMPITRRWSLAELSEALAAYPQRRNFVQGVNYCLLPGINDSRKDAALVSRFCARVGRCLVNLIPYNPGRDPIARAPTAEEEERFLGYLHDEGVYALPRAAKGGSIMAACGQLGGPAAR